MLLTETTKNIHGRENVNNRKTLGMGTSQIKRRNTNGRVVELMTHNTADTSYWEDEEVKKEDLRTPLKDIRKPPHCTFTVQEINSYVKRFTKLAEVSHFPKISLGAIITRSLVAIGWSFKGRVHLIC